MNSPALLHAMLLCAVPPAFAQVVLFDRIGTNTSLATGQPGAVTIHTHPGAVTNDFWATPAARWTQPTDGYLHTASFIFFGRDNRDLQISSNQWDTAERPLTNFQWATMTFHFWTNGLFGFLTNPVHGDVVVPLGPGPENPAPVGLTTNRPGIVFPLFRHDFQPTAPDVLLPLSAGREYLMSLLFESPTTNHVIRLSLSTATGPPDAYAGVNLWPAPGNAGLTTAVGFTSPQYAVALSTSMRAAGRLLIRLDGSDAVLTWEGAGHLGFESSDDPDGDWNPIANTANLTELRQPIAGGTKFYRVKIQE